MPTTRKKIIKTVYKDENSDEEIGGDFSDSGSDAKISDVSSSEDEAIVSENSSADEFHDTSKTKVLTRKYPRTRTNFAKAFVKKINKQINNEEEANKTTVQFSIKDLTDADKLLPSILNLSESDSSDDESQKTTRRNNSTSIQPNEQDGDINIDANIEYRDVWSNNELVQDNSEEIAKKTFKELEQHKSNIEETKEVLQKYRTRTTAQISDVEDLLALGEELPISKVNTVDKKHRVKRHKNDSDSEMEDWEEVKEKKEIRQQGIQLFVEFPDASCRKSKKVDVEMMMKRKMNRVKKEYQVYMHKVHILCWLGHGNYVSKILNDQELMAAALSLVPSKECYPGERVDMKYVEQITAWYKDKLTLNQDKNEDKFKPKAPPLKTILLDLIKRRVVTTKKYLVFIFVALLRALGLQCRVMFNFVALPIKPPVTELCSLSTKDKDSGKTKLSKAGTSKCSNKNIKNEKEPKPSTSKAKAIKQKIVQLDGNNDESFSSDSDMSCSSEHIFYVYENIMQVDGNDDNVKRKTRSSKRTNPDSAAKVEDEDVSPPKIARKMAGSTSPKPPLKSENKNADVATKHIKNTRKIVEKEKFIENESDSIPSEKSTRISKRIQRSQLGNNSNKEEFKTKISTTANTNRKNKAPKEPEALSGNDKHSLSIPNITVTNENNKNVSSKFFEDVKPSPKFSRLSRNRSQTANAVPLRNTTKNTQEQENVDKGKIRTKSAPPADKTNSKYFDLSMSKQNATRKQVGKSKNDILEDKLRVSHRDLTKDNISRKKTKNDVTGDLIDIVKNRIKEDKIEGSRRLVKGKNKKGLDSDYLPEDDHRNSNSDDYFKPTKISPKPSTSARRIDRRVISSSPDEEISNKKKNDVWCEIFVEELEQWISVDIIKGKIHSTGDIYTNATHPVCYIVGWDNNNYLKDLTRKYVPQYNTVTRKIRAEPQWWDKAVRPYLGPKTARDREEDEYLDRMQLEAPLPKSIAEYKNHPLYALKRHLLKFEAIYPPDAAVLGFVRGEPVYGRECVYVCRSRDTWLKEAKVVKLGEQPYKVVKARPKWDKLSNKLITDKPLEVFGIWQVNDYEPPVAENGIVPRNAYGNVELFKDCMLPVGTVHIKLPGLNRVAKKLNIDCAPAMTGFDFNGGWSHPVYDGFVVCKEFEEIVTEAWVKDQEEQERREREKTDLRVYGNWKRLIKGLMIRERLEAKYGFEEPASLSTNKGKSKAPRLVV